MGIRSKKDESKTVVDLVDSDRTPDGTASPSATTRNKRENPTRRLSFAPGKSGKSSRRIVESPVVDKHDPDFEAACLAMVLKPDQDGAEQIAQNSSPTFTPTQEDSLPPASHVSHEEPAIELAAEVLTEHQLEPTEPLEAHHQLETPHPLDVQHPFGAVHQIEVAEPTEQTLPVVDGAAATLDDSRFADKIERQAEAHRLLEAESQGVAARDQATILDLRAEAERHAAKVEEATLTIEHQSAALAERQAEVALLREDLHAHRQHVEILTQRISDREHEVDSLREALSRIENESASQTDMLMRSLHETEAKREADVSELSTAAQQLAEAQYELSTLRESIRQIHAGHEQSLAELRSQLVRQQSDAQNSLDALRHTLDTTEAHRKANASELVAAAEREATAEREIISLRRELSELSAERDAQVGELRELVSRKEMESSALDTALLEREQEWADLHATMIQRDIEALKLTEQLRRALLHSEAQREADAASLLEIMAQREAAEYAERENEVARKHLADY